MRALLFMGLVLILFGLIMLVATRLRRSLSREDKTHAMDAAKTVRCVKCGAFIPQDQAIPTEQGPTCPEHQS